MLAAGRIKRVGSWLAAVQVDTVDRYVSGQQGGGDGGEVGLGIIDDPEDVSGQVGLELVRVS